MSLATPSSSLAERLVWVTTMSLSATSLSLSTRTPEPAAHNKHKAQ